MSINPAQLRGFHAVATVGTFTSAARSLHVTQPTLSNQVAQLEARFDMRLFDRTTRGIHLRIGQQSHLLSW